MKNIEKKMPKGICPFSEIAQLYYPGTSSSYSASRKLRKEIERCPLLLHQLEKLGYTRKTRDLTPAHQLLLQRYIGPFEI